LLGIASGVVKIFHCFIPKVFWNARVSKAKLDETFSSVLSLPAYWNRAKKPERESLRQSLQDSFKKPARTSPTRETAKKVLSRFCPLWPVIQELWVCGLFDDSFVGEPLDIHPGGRKGTKCEELLWQRGV
jgi:hypothetical protein